MLMEMSDIAAASTNIRHCQQKKRKVTLYSHCLSQKHKKY